MLGTSRVLIVSAHPESQQRVESVLATSLLSLESSAWAGAGARLRGLNQHAGLAVVLVWDGEVVQRAAFLHRLSERDCHDVPVVVLSERLLPQIQAWLDSRFGGAHLAWSECEKLPQLLNPMPSAPPSALPWIQGDVSVLVLDDSASVRLSVEEALQRAGFVVHTAANTEQAMTVLSQRSVHLVLVDYHLGQQRGDQVIAHIMQCYPSILCALYTANVAQSVAKKAMQAGAVSVWFKSDPLPLLCTRIQMLTLRLQGQTGSVDFQALLRQWPRALALLNAQGEVLWSNHAWQSRWETLLPSQPLRVITPRVQAYLTDNASLCLRVTGSHAEAALRIHPMGPGRYACELNDTPPAQRLVVYVHARTHEQAAWVALSQLPHLQQQVLAGLRQASAGLGGSLLGSGFVQCYLAPQVNGVKQAQALICWLLGELGLSSQRLCIRAAVGLSQDFTGVQLPKVLESRPSGSVLDLRTGSITGLESSALPQYAE